MLRSMTVGVLFLLLSSVVFGAEAAKASQPSRENQAAGRSAAPRGAPPGPPLGWSRELGLATIVNPSFQGSSSYNVQPVPYFDFRYRDALGVKYFANVPQGFGAYVYRKQSKTGVRHAVSVALAPGFANRDPDDLDGLDTFGPSVEARVGWELSYRAWALSASLSQALGTGHEGLYADLSTSWRRRVGQRGFLAVGPNLRLGNDRYMNAFYGVAAAEAARTGLSAYEADAGLESLGLQAIFSVPLTGKWRWTTVAQLSLLASEADDSSLTEESQQGFFLTAVTSQF